MAKCIRCGKSTALRGHVKLSDADLCLVCFKDLGFERNDALISTIYKYDEIKNGKDAYYTARIENRTSSTLEEFKIHGISHENENGVSIQKILSDFVQEEFEDDKLTNAEVKEELEYEDHVYLYPTMDAPFSLEVTTFDGAPAIKVYLEISYGTYEHIGWIPKRSVDHVLDIINNHDYEVTGELIGGPFKYRDEDDKIRTDRTEYGGRVYISYKSKV